MSRTASHGSDFTSIDDCPSCFRYPRGAGTGVNMKVKVFKYLILGLKGMVLDIGREECCTRNRCGSLGLW